MSVSVGAFLFGMGVGVLVKLGFDAFGAWASPVGGETGGVELDFRYTAYPEVLFRLLERDLAVLGPQDRVHLHLLVEAKQGWNGPWTWQPLPIHGRVEDVLHAVRFLLMEVESPLTTTESMSRQYDEEDYPEIHAWGERTGLTTLRWADSDSPLVFRLTGRIWDVPEPEEMPEVEPLRKAAQQEVEELAQRHSAALRSRHAQKRP